MDKEYILMCDCEEIQEQWKKVKCDFFAWIESDIVYKIRQVGVPYGNLHPSGYGVWLPTQSQLQRMVDKPYQSSNLEMQNICRHAQLRTMFSSMGEFLKTIDQHTLTSMEQLWLAFVMKERYNKVWSTEKEEWVSQSR